MVFGQALYGACAVISDSLYTLLINSLASVLKGILTEVARLVMIVLMTVCCSSKAANTSWRGGKLAHDASICCCGLWQTLTPTFFVTHPVCTQDVPTKKKILIPVPNKDYHDKDVIYAYQLYVEQTLVGLRTWALIINPLLLLLKASGMKSVGNSCLSSVEV